MSPAIWRNIEQREKLQGTATKLALQRRGILASCKCSGLRQSWQEQSKRVSKAHEARDAEAALPWCDPPAALPGSPGHAVFLSAFLEGATKVEQRLMEQKAELTSMCLSAAAPKVGL